LDEVGHLPAGCLVAGFSNFDLYKVNPPLIKGIAGIPVVAAGPRYDWSGYLTDPGMRSEWTVGQMMITANGTRSFWLVTTARWTLLLFWLVGVTVATKWNCRLNVQSEHLGATVLWCFTPEVMCWTATICPDSSAAALGILYMWIFRSWLQDLQWTSASLAGISLGIALLAKSSWIILIPLCPLIAMLHKHCRRGMVLRQLLLMAIISLSVVNAGYNFDRSFVTLDEFKFFSACFAGRRENGTFRQRIPTDYGNRFSNTIVGKIPIPLPASFVEGLDLQKYDFEEGKWSYLRGEHKFGGWWYWYIYALLVKTPVGTIGLFFIACGWAVWKVEWRNLARSSLKQCC